MPAHLWTRHPAAPAQRAATGAARAGRCVRRFHALELSLHPGGPQGRGSDRRRLQRDPQGPGRHAQRDRRDGALVPRGRVAAWRLQRGLGGPGGGLHVPAGIADRSQGVLHGLRARGSADRGACGRAAQADDAGTRRPFPGDRLRGRRRRARGGPARHAQVRQRRADLHLTQSLLHPREDLRPLHGALHRSRERHQGRRRARSRHAHGSARARAAATGDGGVRAGRTGARCAYRDWRPPHRNRRQLLRADRDDRAATAG